MSDVGEYWDERYAEEDFAFGQAANVFLVSQARYCQAGMKALAVGDGEGRNGVWLAQQGLSVLSVDASPLGLAKAAALADQRGVALSTHCVDLTEWEWPVGAYDVVVALYVHFASAVRSRMHAAMLKSLRVGGVLILEGFSQEQSVYQQRYDSGGPRDADMLFDLEMLKQDWAAAECLHSEACELTLDQGSFHQGLASVVRMVVKR